MEAAKGALTATVIARVLPMVVLEGCPREVLEVVALGKMRTQHICSVGNWRSDCLSTTRNTPCMIYRMHSR